MPAESALAATRDLIAFIDASPTPYHAVAEVVRRLEAKGYQPLDEREAWSIQAGDRRYVVRSGATVVAFEAGADAPSDGGFLLVGAHTDSPNFRIKPKPDVKSAGYRQVGVEVYGGVLYTTWMDRDLSIAGRVSLATGESRLVDFRRALCRMPNVAIHLNRSVNKDGLVLNPQKHMLPMLSTAESELGFVDLVAKQIDEAPDAIAGFDLCVYDLQGGSVGGVDNEFLFSARVDNLASCHAAVEALLGSGEPTSPTRVVALYDHEEIGSQSDAGAKSRFLSSVLERVAQAYGGGSQAVDRAFARSLLVSADMAHAVNPNYVDKHDKQHQPKLGAGPVIKINASQSYATDGPAAAVFEQACKEGGFSAQRFVSRADMPCGSTIGPISAARMGIRTVDVGNPMLSMHSCREVCGTADVPMMIGVLDRLFRGASLPPPSA